MKKILTVVLCLALLFGALSGCAAEKQIIAEPHTFRFNTVEGTCYYSDDYFKQDAYAYSASLSTMSLALALSAFNAKDKTKEGDAAYLDGAKNAKQLLTDIGFAAENIETNEWYSQKPTTDSIAVIAGQKKIRDDGKDYTLIALAVRGGNYEQEWASNFTLGKTGAHKGFAEARDNVLSFLQQFIKNQKISGDVKLWIAGYSRGGATANLTAGALDDILSDGGALADGVYCTPKNLYAYCFGPPAGAVAEDVNGVELYGNIFNIVNADDLVPLVAPRAYGFGRYGIDLVLPSRKTDEKYAEHRDAMLEIFDDFPDIGKYNIDDFRMKKFLQYDEWNAELSFFEDDKNDLSSQGLFLDTFIRILSQKAFESREVYASDYEDVLREIFSYLFKGEDEDNVEFLLTLADFIFKNAEQGMEKEDENIEDFLPNALSEALYAQNQTELPKEAASKIAEDLVAQLRLLLYADEDVLTTFLCNVSSITMAHQPLLCMAWLEAMDRNYNGKLPLCFSNGSYRMVSVIGDVDSCVSDAQGNTLAETDSGEPQQGTDSTLIVFTYDEGNAASYILPVDKAYTVSVSANDDEKISYFVEEYSAQTGEFVKSAEYWDIPVQNGDTLTGTIPTYSQNDMDFFAPFGSSVEYSLTGKEGKLTQNRTN